MSRKHRKSMSFLHLKRERARLKKVRKIKEMKANKLVSTGDLLKNIKLENQNEDNG